MISLVIKWTVSNKPELEQLLINLPMKDSSVSCLITSTELQPQLINLLTFQIYAKTCFPISNMKLFWRKISKLLLNGQRSKVQRNSQLLVFAGEFGWQCISVKIFQTFYLQIVLFILQLSLKGFIKVILIACVRMWKFLNYGALLRTNNLMIRKVEEEWRRCKLH